MLPFVIYRNILKYGLTMDYNLYEKMFCFCTRQTFEWYFSVLISLLCKKLSLDTYISALLLVEVKNIVFFFTVQE